MAIEFEDILTALCSKVELKHANESQKTFLLYDNKEAGLACHVLAAHGFDAKIYPQDNASKLYITLPSPDPAAQEKFSAALAYAITLKQIKQNLDALCHNHAAALQSPDYHIAFVDTPSSGKQIIINVTRTASPDTAASPAELPSSPDARKPVKAAKVRKYATVNEKNSFFYGPSVGGKSLKKNFKSALRPNSLWKEVFNYLYGHAEAMIYGMVIGMIFLIVLLTISIFLKGFLCPDFATAKKNSSWYCRQLYHQ